MWPLKFEYSVQQFSFPCVLATSLTANASAQRCEACDANSQKVEELETHLAGVEEERSKFCVPENHDVKYF